jgi:transcriptional regulator with XRE-family HTH domain
LITSDQVRAGRALLRISVSELAKLSDIGVATIKRIEAGSGLPSANVRTIDALIRAFQHAGVEFIGTPDDRPGVRLK